MRGSSLHTSIIIGLVCAALGLVALSSGYDTTNAMIIARSVTVKSTISGEVTGVPFNVGSRVEAGDGLVSVHNKRVDPTNLIELRAQLDLLEKEQSLTQAQKTNAHSMHQYYSDHAGQYQSWLAGQYQYDREQIEIKLDTAAKSLRLAQSALTRARELERNGNVSATELLEFEHRVNVARNEQSLLRSEKQRLMTKQSQIEQDALYQKDGDNNYWARMVKEYEQSVLAFDQSLQAIAARIKNLQRQIELEDQRLTNVSEELHRSPFTGVVNAVFASQGDLVTAETPLIEILDCTNPVVVVSVPEHRLGDYFVGQPASVTPMDSNETHFGQVQHISSGALIGRDTTLAIEPELLQSGNKITIAFDKGETDAFSQSCDTARRARVSIEVQSILERLFI